MAEGVGALPWSTPGPSPGNPNCGISWDPFSPYRDTPLSRLTAHLAGGRQGIGELWLSGEGAEHISWNPGDKEQLCPCLWLFQELQTTRAQCHPTKGTRPGKFTGAL